MRRSGKWTKFKVIEVHSLKTESNRLNNKPLLYNRIVTLSQKQNSEDAIWEDVTVCIVTYNSAAVIESCLKPLLAAAKIIIVDNASTDDTCSLVQRISPGIEIIKNKKNIGYGAAMNMAMSRVKTDYGFAINPDAIIQPDAIKELVNASKIEPRPAIICPFLHDGKGKAEVSVMGPNELHHSPMTADLDGNFCSWFVTGAALLYRMSAWRDIGGYDETFFLYSEDNDLALRTTKKGYSMVIAPKATVIHNGGTSSRPSTHVVWLKNWHMAWSHLYLTAKHVDVSLARREAIEKAFKYGLKAIFYWLVFQWARARRDGARLSACLSYLFRPLSIARHMGEK